MEFKSQIETTEHYEDILHKINEDLRELEKRIITSQKYVGKLHKNSPKKKYTKFAISNEEKLQEHIMRQIIEMNKSRMLVRGFLIHLYYIDRLNHYAMKI